MIKQVIRSAGPIRLHDPHLGYLQIRLESLVLPHQLLAVRLYTSLATHIHLPFRDLPSSNHTSLDLKQLICLRLSYGVPRPPPLYCCAHSTLYSFASILACCILDCTLCTAWPHYLAQFERHNLVVS